MRKPESAKSYSVIGAVISVGGVLILLLALLNYLQDGRLSLTAVMGLMLISLGLLLYAQGKGRKGQGG